MKQKKAIIIIQLILLTILLQQLVLAAEAQGSYKIEGDKINFIIPATKEGVYAASYIYKDDLKLTTLLLCQDVRCYGKLNTTYNITPELQGEYELIYYEFEKSNWKNISFNINGQQILDNFASKNNNQKIDSNSNQETSLIKRAMVIAICKLQNLFNSEEYLACRDEYLSR